MSNVDLGSIIRRLLAMRPLSKLSEGEQMVVAGQIGGAMQEAIRPSERHTTDEALRLLRRHVDECGSQREFARRNDVSVQFVSDVLKGKREPTDRIMAAVGLKRVIYYEPLSSAAAPTP